MIRAFDRVEVNAEGNVERELLRERMRDYGFGPISTIGIDLLTSSFMRGLVPEGWFNLTWLFLESVMNHPAAMNSVDRKLGKVDVPQVEVTVRDLERFSDDGIIDVLSLSKLQQVNQARDRDIIWEIKSEGGVMGYLKGCLMALFRFCYAKVISVGELSLLILMFGYRDSITRTRLIHTKQWGDILSNGQLPKGYEKESSNLIGVATLVNFIFILQLISWLPDPLARMGEKMLMLGYTIYCAAANRLRQLITTPFGLWRSAKRVRRSELREMVNSQNISF